FPSRSLHAQLRPLDPLDHGVYEPGTGVIVEVGAGVYDGQRASLAGTEGRLLEFGQLHVLWRWDRVAFEAAGTVLRRFDDRAVSSAPVPGTREVDGARRQDAGDFRLATVVTLWARPAGAVALRFGTRLPTTDNETGLERDRTDFFALVAAGWRLGPVQVAAESGVGIHGTRDDGMEQVDVWLYALSVGYRWGTVVPGVAFVGQADGLSGDSLRGTKTCARWGSDAAAVDGAGSGSAWSGGSPRSVQRSGSPSRSAHRSELARTACAAIRVAGHTAVCAVHWRPTPRWASSKERDQCRPSSAGNACRTQRRGSGSRLAAPRSIRPASSTSSARTTSSRSRPRYGSRRAAARGTSRP